MISTDRGRIAAEQEAQAIKHEEVLLKDAETAMVEAERNFEEARTRRNHLQSIAADKAKEAEEAAAIAKDASDRAQTLEEVATQAKTKFEELRTAINARRGHGGRKNSQPGREEATEVSVTSHADVPDSSAENVQPPQQSTESVTKPEQVAQTDDIDQIAGGDSDIGASPAEGQTKPRKKRRNRKRKKKNKSGNTAACDPTVQASVTTTTTPGVPQSPYAQALIDQVCAHLFLCPLRSSTAESVGL